MAREAFADVAGREAGQVLAEAVAQEPAHRLHRLLRRLGGAEASGGAAARGAAAQRGAEVAAAADEEGGEDGEEIDEGREENAEC